ncbi:hypothetical protein ACVWZ3_005885 [Bradyrhizobium sp. i1.3.6]
MATGRRQRRPHRIRQIGLGLIGQLVGENSLGHEIVEQALVGIGKAVVLREQTVDIEPPLADFERIAGNAELECIRGRRGHRIAAENVAGERPQPAIEDRHQLVGIAVQQHRALFQLHAGEVEQRVETNA